MTLTSETLTDRLWSRVDRTGDGCWEWQGYRMPFGYGQIGAGDGSRLILLTHRVAWESVNGPIPNGLVVRHRCDNPPCCRPDHLEVGTYKENMQDAIERGRFVPGPRHPLTRLTPADVEHIRATYKVFTVPGRRGRSSNARDLAALYGVTPKYVRDVAGGHER